MRASLHRRRARIATLAFGRAADAVQRLRLDLDTDEIDARPYMEDLLAEIRGAQSIDLAMVSVLLRELRGMV